MRHQLSAALFSLREWRHFALCLPTHRRAGGLACGQLSQPLGFRVYGNPARNPWLKRTSRHGIRRHACGNRATPRSQRIFEVSLAAGLDSRVIPLFRRSQSRRTVRPNLGTSPTPDFMSIVLLTPGLPRGRLTAPSRGGLHGRHPLHPRRY